MTNRVPGVGCVGQSVTDAALKSANDDPREAPGLSGDNCPCPAKGALWPPVGIGQAGTRTSSTGCVRAGAVEWRRRVRLRGAGA